MACFPQEEAEGMNRRKGTEGEKQKDTGKNRIKRMVSLFFLLAAVLAALFIYHLYQEDKRYLGRFKVLKEIEEKNTYIDKKKSENGNNPDWIGWFKIKDTDILTQSCSDRGTPNTICTGILTGRIVFMVRPFWTSAVHQTATTASFTVIISMAAGCSGRSMPMPEKVIIRNTRRYSFGQDRKRGPMKSCR
jgi:cell division protein FtsL